jgi:1-acyl-sn-glycerol-3-phosphate acyltransferase
MFILHMSMIIAFFPCRIGGWSASKYFPFTWKGRAWSRGVLLLHSSGTWLDAIIMGWALSERFLRVCVESIFSSE